MILRLGYAELRVKNLDVSIDFYVNVLGFIESKREGNKVYLRGIEEFDEYSLILTENAESEFDHFGLRVSSEKALTDIKKKHDDLGLEVHEYEEKGKKKLLRVITPSGHPVSFYHYSPQINIYQDGGKGVSSLPMRNSHMQKGVPPLRIDHVNLRVPNVNREIDYWNHFDFSISEYVEGETEEEKYAAWIRRETNTHDIALVNAQKSALHHVAYCVDGVSGVVRTADLLADAGYRDSIEYGPGRHGVTNAFFLYIRDPDGHRMEIYNGDYKRDLDQKPVVWTKKNYEEKGRLWWGADVPESFKETSPIKQDWNKVTQS